MEREEIIMCWHDYEKLKTLKHGKNVVGIDVNQYQCGEHIGHSMPYKWKDKRLKSTKDAFLKGLATGHEHPTHRGPRFVIALTIKNQPIAVVAIL